MYKNLEAELKRIDKSYKDLAKLLNLHVSTISAKMNGHTDFLLRECRNIKIFWFPNLTLDYLFEIKKEN